jgi:hypothetical protein
MEIQLSSRRLGLVRLLAGPLAILWMVERVRSVIGS